MLSLALIGFFPGTGIEVRGQQGPSEITDANPLALPRVGDYRLQILSPTVLELTLINTKDFDPARPTGWDFVGSNFSFSPPSAAEFAVTANGRTISVRSVGFKRRPIYAPLKTRDLRIGNYLYLELSTPVADSEAVEVKNPNGRLWKAPVEYRAVMAPGRLNPAIHVNQIGYAPSYQKLAMVGYYLGSLGEMTIPAQNGFKVVDAKSGAVVFQGPLTWRQDKGFAYAPTPYQKVFQADFSAFTTPGKYQLMVPGMGTSFPFQIDEGVPAGLARTFALGLFHQRCGMDNAHPFTRHTHENCHTAAADVPTMASTYSKVQEFLALVTEDWQKTPGHTAPRLKDVNSSLYPFVKQGKIDVSRGHHDAGDYSKYTINSAGLIHYLVFAADSFPGAGELDNLGIPESGDGKSDLLQEAKWEADFLAKLQDSDGGFYFLVYPKDRRYEDNVLPDKGDAQVVWPKTTSVTAAAVAALAEIGSSPRFKQQFPAEAAVYLQKAQLGWTFLMSAIGEHGKDGAYQKITHYGNEFGHNDELAWAAAALFAATGNEMYHGKLMEWLPDPNHKSTWRWEWWRLFEGYGCAIRTYAFAAASGRVNATRLNTSYLAKCEAEIVAAGVDAVRFSRESAYGTSFPDPNKQFRSAGWYFSSERAFDATVAYQLIPDKSFREAVVANFNYEAGANPLNMTFITGVGYKRQRDVVHQYAQNDHRVLPPSGLPLGNIQQGFPYLENYKAELGTLSYPPDYASTAPYPYYDRWGDTFNTTTEFVVTDQARSLASLAFWMAQSPVKAQSWRAVQGEILGLPSQIKAKQPISVSLFAPGVDLSKAQVTWEVRFMEPGLGNPYTFAPLFPGDHWIEAEAMLPDGRRVFASANFVAGTPDDMPPNSYQAEPLAVTSDIVGLYHGDEDSSSAAGTPPNLAFTGKARIDQSNNGWMNKPAGGAFRFFDLGDQAQVQFPSSAIRAGSDTTTIALEAMVYINTLKAYNRGVATILSLNQSWDAYLELKEDKYSGLMVQGGQGFAVSGATLQEALTPQAWHHLSISLSQSGYTLKVNGRVIGSVSSGDLARWGSSPTVTLTLGNFDGWIDEVAVRSFRSGAPTLPSVSLITPISGSTLEGVGTVNISAAASASGAMVQKVEFYAGQTKIGEDASFPYAITWTAPAGNYNITARAYDSRGLVGISAPAGVTIRQASAGASATLQPIRMLSDGKFLLSLRGQVGSTYRIQASEDHKNWVDIGTVGVTESVTAFMDPVPAGSLRFYRAVLTQ